MAAGRLILPLSEPMLDSTGAVTPGATLTVYLTGTTTPATIYADVTLSSPILNPQTSDAAGRFYEQSTTIFADAANQYDCVLSLPDGELFTYDGLSLVSVAPNLASFAPINSPVFTGAPQAPTPATNDNSAKLATTAFVTSKLGSFAPLDSPDFTGTPTAPTGTSGDASTQVATDAFVANAITNYSASVLGQLARAYVLFVGSTSNGPQSILKAFNVASVTRTAQGSYDVLFSTPLTDANYIPQLTGQASTTPGGSVFNFNVQNGTSLATTGFTISVTNQTGSTFDPHLGFVTVFG